MTGGSSEPPRGEPLHCHNRKFGSIKTLLSVKRIDGFLDGLIYCIHKKSPCITEAYSFNMAEREGFEPSLGLTLNTLSRRAPSATQPPLQIFYYRIKPSLGLTLNTLSGVCPAGGESQSTQPPLQILC